MTPILEKEEEDMYRRIKEETRLKNLLLTHRCPADIVRIIVSAERMGLFNVVAQARGMLNKL